jgi:hypothetical protein
MNAELVDLGPCAGFRITADETRWAVVLPGAKGTALSSATWFTYAALAAHGWSGVLVLDQYAGGDRVAYARERYAAALGTVPPEAQVCVVAKSLSSELAPDVAAAGLPAVWLTPLLRDGAVADGIARNAAPQLIVAGTADDLHEPQIARRLDADVLELEGADHSLGILRRPLESLDLLRTLVERVSDFAQRL